jgi:cytochrome c5
MKKISYLMLVVLMGGIAAIMFLYPQSASSQKKQVQTTQVIPENVAQILKKSCTSCHDAGGSGLAPSVWSFSDWKNYPAKKQAKKASAMCRDMTNGSMPPSSVPKDKKPTQAQIDEICKWATSIQPAN